MEVLKADVPEHLAYGGRPSSPSGKGYLRSTIGFPYSSLRDAEAVVKELHDEWGGKASPDQLAAGMGASPKSGAFRTKLATARTFGVTVATRGSIAVTELGRRLIDPESMEAARVEAFMTVPLFAALAEAYKGAVLPPDAGLEAKIRDLGVSARQTAKARQAFQRSAEQAGFFKHGRQRLVAPAVSGSTRDAGASSERAALNGSGSGDDGTLPEPLVDLWVTLLDEGGAWSPERTHQYVAAARLLRDALAEEP